MMTANEHETHPDAQSETGYIFLSYSRRDAEMMASLKEKLKERGLSVWTDEGLEPGTDSWRTAIQEAIQYALGLVVLLSPSAKKSDWVEREIVFARAQGIKIYPVLIAGNAQNAIPIELINAQWVDIRDQTKLEEQLNQLVETIQAAKGISSDLPQITHTVPVPAATPNRFTTFISAHKGASAILIAVVLGIIVLAGVLPQFRDHPSLQAFFSNHTTTPTVTVTRSLTPQPPTATPTPSPPPTRTPTPEPVSAQTTQATATISPTPTITLTPSHTITPAFTLPAISEAECVPKETIRQKAYVIEAPDGQTLKVRIDGDLHLVQYLGLTVPDRESYFGIYAHYKSIELVVDRWVTLVIDENVADTAEYLYRYVFVDNLFVNYELIHQGFAFADGGFPENACTEFFEHAQQQARLAPRGMWKPTHTPWPTPAPGEPPCSCAADTRNCDSFINQSAAQACFEYCQGLGKGDVHHLDANGNNIACEE